MNRSDFKDIKNPTLTLIMGPMKSGKSAESIVVASKYGRFMKIVVVKPQADTTCDVDVTTSRLGLKVSCLCVKNLSDIVKEKAFLDAFLVIIDEAQFFPDLLEHVKKWKSEKSYHVAGLDADSDQNKFGQLWDLIPYATTVTKMTAMCEICKDGTEAIATISMEVKKEQVQIDDRENSKYLSVCGLHI